MGVSISFKGVLGTGVDGRRALMVLFFLFILYFCFVFVILSGFLILLTLAWLHFSLRAQSQDLSALSRAASVVLRAEEKEKEKEADEKLNSRVQEALLAAFGLKSSEKEKVEKNKEKNGFGDYSMVC